MKKFIITLSFMIPLFLVYGFSIEQNELLQRLDETTDTDELFYVEIYQNGEWINISTHQVYLKKSTFDICLFMKEDVSVLMNCSPEPDFYDGFSEGKLLDEILEEPDMFMGMAENSFNEDRLIVFHDTAAHYLFYDNDNFHRFNKNEVYQYNDFIIGVRTVENFATIENWNENQFMPINQLPADKLYFIFFCGGWDNNYNRIEKERDYLELIFI